MICKKKSCRASPPPAHLLPSRAQPGAAQLQSPLPPLSLTPGARADVTVTCVFNLQARISPRRVRSEHFKSKPCFARTQPQVSLFIPQHRHPFSHPKTLTISPPGCLNRARIRRHCRRRNLRFPVRTEHLEASRFSQTSCRFCAHPPDIFSLIVPVPDQAIRPRSMLAAALLNSGEQFGEDDDAPRVAIAPSRPP